MAHHRGGSDLNGELLTIGISTSYSYVFDGQSLTGERCDGKVMSHRQIENLKFPDRRPSPQSGA